MTNGLWVLLAILYTAIRIMKDIGSCDGGMLAVTLAWLNAWMYCNCCYNCFVCYPQIGIFMYVLHKGNGTPFITYKLIALLSYIPTFVHVSGNKLCTKVGDCLYWLTVSNQRQTRAQFVHTHLVLLWLLFALQCQVFQWCLYQ